MSYLLAWHPNLEIKDNDGNTALHLAVKAVDAMESTRPVRFLLVHGANKNARDNNQEIPLDLIESEVSSQNHVKDLHKMLVSNGKVRNDVCACLG